MPDDDDPEAAVERIERLSDEELLAEAAAAGVDVPAEAARVRGVLTDAVRRAKADLDCWSPALPAALAVSPVCDLVLLYASPAERSRAVLEAIARQSPPAALMVDRPKAAEPELPIDVSITVPFVGRFRGDGCSPMCRVLDGPDRRRGLPLKCICGRYPS
jgi:hypothetical protein